MGNVIQFNKSTSHTYCEEMYFVEAIDHFYKNYEPNSRLKPPVDYNPILFYGGMLDDINYYTSFTKNKWIWNNKNVTDEKKELIKMISSVLRRHLNVKFPFPHFYIRETYKENSEIINVFHIKEKAYRRYLIPNVDSLLEKFEITPEKPIGSYRDTASSVFGIGRRNYLDKFFKYIQDITDEDYHKSESLDTIIQTYKFTKHSVVLLHLAE